MADEELVAELAEVLYEAAGVRRSRAHQARDILAWLAERGRLVPDGAKVDEQWGIRRPDRPDVDGFSFGRDEQDARDYLARHAGHGHNDVLIHRQVITGPWVAVDEETT